MKLSPKKNGGGGVDKQFTMIPDVLWENKELSLLGVVLLAHIQRRENGEHKACTESAGNMAEHFHVSLSSIKREVEKLAKGGYISKEIARGIGWKLNTLPKVGIPILGELSQSRLTQSRLTQSSESTHTELGVSSHRARGELTQSYKETKEDTKKKQKKIKGDKSPKGKKCPSFSPFSSLPDGEVKAALLDYAKVRKGGKSPIRTERQEKLLLDKLNELSKGDRGKQVKIINEAIVRGWLSFYPLTEDKEAVKVPVVRKEADVWQGFNTRLV